ncbi:TPA: hypothetical protein EYP83_02630 [Candidatus Geothermarchaeota archaeon]|nr:hypothetical protein [Candidatus Geothermarchaeota archaeon]
MRVRDLFLIILIFSVSALITYNYIVDIPEYSREYILEASITHRKASLPILNIPPRNVTLYIIVEGDIEFNIRFINIYGVETTILNEVLDGNKVLSFTPETSGYLVIESAMDPGEGTSVTIEVKGGRNDLNIILSIASISSLLGYISSKMVSGRGAPDWI